MVIGLDPSSTKTGYAVMRSETELVECGLFRPHRPRDPALARVMTMCDEFREMLYPIPVADLEVIIETAQLGKGQIERAKGAGLAVYGYAVGALYREAVSLVGQNRVHRVGASDWSQGVRKAVRQQRVAMQFPQYDVACDPGGDASDAIGLLLWWFRMRREAAAIMTTQEKRR